MGKTFSKHLMLKPAIYAGRDKLVRATDTGWASQPTMRWLPSYQETSFIAWKRTKAGYFGAIVATGLPVLPRPCRTRIFSSHYSTDACRHFRLQKMASTLVFTSRLDISVAQPLITGRTVSWPTDKGHYNVAYFDRIGPIKYRIRANGPIVATPAKLGRVLFFSAMDGYVYAIDEVVGSIFWEYSTGSSISQSPLAVDDSVYFVTDNEELFKVDSKSGTKPVGWPKSIPNIHRLIGAANELVYAQDPSGNLVGIRADTGAKAFSFFVGDGLHLINSQTDRVFLVSHSGAIQCLRQTKQVHPQFHVPVSESITGDEQPKKPQRRATKLDEQIRNPFESKEELSQDPFIATEPVYDNPFLVTPEGEVNPFQLDEGADAVRRISKNRQKTNRLPPRNPRNRPIRMIPLIAAVSPGP